MSMGYIYHIWCQTGELKISILFSSLEYCLSYETNYTVCFFGNKSICSFDPLIIASD